MKRIHAITALSLSLFPFALAMAAEGYITGDVNMRAGPDSSYPGVVMLETGTEVSIQGCVDGWSWCDVIAGGNRGWVAGSNLQEEFQGQRVFVPSYGVQIGIPIITFVFGSYWDSYYRNRPWYGQREHWSHVTPNYRPVAARNDPHYNETAGSLNHAHGAPANDAGPAHASHTQVTSQLRSSTVAAAPTTRHAATSSAVTPQQHAVPVDHTVTQAHSSAPHATTSTAATSQHHAAPADHTVTQARASTPHAAPAHSAPAQKASRPASPEKSAPKEKGDEDKGQH
jgi:uncharacterized protein YraI